MLKLGYETDNHNRKIKKGRERSVNIGYRIVKEFHRPPQSLIQGFAKIPVPNIGDSMNRTAAVSSALRPYNQARLLGPAYTVRVPAGDNLLFYYAIDQAMPGDIIVVDGGGFKERALCGEIMVDLAIARGLGGFVVDGAIRDAMELAGKDFPVFARCASPNGPYKNGPGEVNVPVNIGGRVIEPGDILIGDGNGLVAVKPDEAEEVLEKARAVIEKESRMMESIHEKKCLDLAWMYEKIEKDQCSVI